MFNALSLLWGLCFVTGINILNNGSGSSAVNYWMLSLDLGKLSLSRIMRVAPSHTVNAMPSFNGCPVPLQLCTLKKWLSFQNHELNPLGKNASGIAIWCCYQTSIFWISSLWDSNCVSFSAHWLLDPEAEPQKSRLDCLYLTESVFLPHTCCWWCGEEKQ